MIYMLASLRSSCTPLVRIPLAHHLTHLAAPPVFAPSAHSRDHADLYSTYQELYRWPRVAEAGKKALGMRYRLLTYLYTSFWIAHNTGVPVMRPLWMNFPADSKTHENVRQFMVGDAVLVTPVLHQGADSVEGYLPAGTWHSLWDLQESIAVK